jgi:predicted Zn-dependent protease
MNSRLLITRILGILFFAAIPSISSASIEDAYAALEAGETHRAKQLFQLELKDDPGSLQAKLGMAEIYYRTRRMSEAESLVEVVLISQPQNLWAQYIKAQIELEKDNLSEAKKILEYVVAKQPDNALAKRDLANLLYRLGETESADVIYRELMD